MVLLKGPGAEFELPYEGAVFAGPAKEESRGYWLAREGAVVSMKCQAGRPRARFIRMRLWRRASANWPSSSWFAR